MVNVKSDEAPVSDGPIPAPESSSDQDRLEPSAADTIGSEATESSEGQAEASEADQLALMTKQRDEANDRLRRANAELENFRKRTERERQRWNERTLRSIVSGVLDSLDLFDKAIEMAQSSKDYDSLLEGVEMVRTSLTGLVESRGATRIDTEGQKFDPRFHEAVLTECLDDVGDGLITEELRRGYRLGDFVLRAAQVKVNRSDLKVPPSEPEAPAESGSSFNDVG